MKNKSLYVMQGNVVYDLYNLSKGLVLKGNLDKADYKCWFREEF